MLVHTYVIAGIDKKFIASKEWKNNLTITCPSNTGHKPTDIKLLTL